MSQRQESRSFVSDQEDLPEDVLYWANLFKATPQQVASAMEQVEEHPEPEAGRRRRPTAADLHKPRP
jgi:hypothetical protein